MRRHGNRARQAHIVFVAAVYRSTSNSALFENNPRLYTGGVEVVDSFSTSGVFTMLCH